MLHRIAKTLRFPTARLACPLLLLGSLTPLLAQAAPPIAPAQFDPSDVYFQGYLATKSAERLEEAKDFAAAAVKLAEARKMFDAVHRYFPAWKSEMVDERMARNAAAESRIFPLAEVQRQRDNAAVAELEGGARQSGEIVDPAAGVTPLTPPGLLQIDPLAARRLNDAEAEVKRLKDVLSSKPDLLESSRNASRVRDIAKQRDAMQAQLKAAERNLERVRGQLAARPVEEEMRGMQERLDKLQQERQAMGMALEKSRGSHTEALSQIAILQADLSNVQKKRADLERDLSMEREVSNKVIAGQQAQLKALQKDLEDKSAELGKANERIAGLVRELEESNAASEQLRTERDSLLQERNQMSALLKLDNDSRIEDLIQQNMGLAKDLREANERLDSVGRDDNATKDELTAAKRDLGVAKSRINRLVEEKRARDQRLAELESRLRGEEHSLAAGTGSSNPAEVEALREIIRRQLRMQERRRQARDLLLEAARDMGAKDEELAKAVKLFDAEEMELTPEEQKLMAGRADFELTSPFARDRASVDRSTKDLNRDIAVFERTAEKAFAAGRYLPTRELFEMIVEQHPGHVPTLCKLGVVQLKLKDPAAAAETFRRAVELNADNPYANRMLAYSCMLLGDLPTAAGSAKEAVKLAPDDARNQLLLGNINTMLKDFAAAESDFKAAISADPMLSEPYYNLAVIYAQTGRMDEARESYSTALERGALPDAELEKRISK